MLFSNPHTRLRPAAKITPFSFCYYSLFGFVCGGINEIVPAEIRQGLRCEAYYAVIPVDGLPLSISPISVRLSAKVVQWDLYEKSYKLWTFNAIFERFVRKIIQITEIQRNTTAVCMKNRTELMDLAGDRSILCEISHKLGSIVANVLTA